MDRKGGKGQFAWCPKQLGYAYGIDELLDRRARSRATHVVELDLPS